MRSDREIMAFRKVVVTASPWAKSRLVKAMMHEAVRQLSNPEADFPANLKDVSTLIKHIKLITDPECNKKQ